MDETMINLCNIMPVELAIRRELEYRSKMEILKDQPQYDLKPLVLPQDPPTEAWEEDAELAPSIYQQPPLLQFSSSSQTFKEKPAFSCKACQLTFPSVFHLSSHVVGQQHKVNISEMKKRREAISNPIWCELCGCSCSSLGEVEAHLNGWKHSSSLSKSTKKGKRKR